MTAVVHGADLVAHGPDELVHGEDDVTLYPVGYARQFVTLARLEELHAPKMHPEFRRRLFAWIESKGGLIGIGGGWRPTPDPVSPASSQGKSFHQDQRFASGFVGYAAVDLVARNGTGNHRSPTWAETEDGPGFGVHTFIKTPDPEPWHMQCVEMRGWQAWVDAGRPDPTATQPEPEPPEDDMTPLVTPQRAYDSRPEWQNLVDPTLRAANQTVPLFPLEVGQYRKIFTGLAPGARVNVTAIGLGGSGYVEVTGSDVRPTSSLVNFSATKPVDSNGGGVATPDGHVYVWCFGAPCDVAIDVRER